MGKEFYFETDDRLDRKKYAEFLKTLLEHCDEYRREDSDGAYVIAIDSPWGTGKTRFAKMLRNYLENRTSKTTIEAPIDPSSGFLTVYYNAWDTDFSNDALEPLIYSLINSPELESELFEKQADEEIDNFIDSAKKVLKVIGLSAAHHFLGETVAKVLNDCNDEIDNSLDEVCDYEKRRNAIEDFRETLSLVIERTRNKKLVIIVDELDRCRPNYAIKTLEIAKHLFSVRGLVFIFSLDIKQLSCSVKTIYGQEMDSAGYLCRFFDFIGQLQNPNMLIYIENLLSIAMYPCVKEASLYSDVAKFIYEATNCYNLKLRDITTIIQTYRIMQLAFLHKYPIPEAHKIYICLIVIKYKDIDLYNKLLHEKHFDNIDPNEVFISQEQKSIHSFCNRLSLFTRSEKIKDTEYVVIPGGKGRATSISGVKVIAVEEVANGYQLNIHYEKKTTKSGEQDEYYFGAQSNLSHMLFYNDIQKWETIKDLSLGMYYHQQLEMFNFALPSEGSES